MPVGVDDRHFVLHQANLRLEKVSISSNRNVVARRCWSA
jgi:hypothetical protein